MSRKSKKAQPVEEQEPAAEVSPEEAVEAVAEETAEKAEKAEQAAEQEANDWKDKYLRALAELDNLRKRQDRERDHMRRFALEDLLRSILPVFDALEYALAAEGNDTCIRDGVELALNEAHRILGAKGFEPIEALHQPFDPRFHEAVGMAPDPDHPPGTVIKEERRGYRLHDRVLRASRVHISIELPEVRPEAADVEESEQPEEDEK